MLTTSNGVCCNLFLWRRCAILLQAFISLFLPCYFSALLRIHGSLCRRYVLGLGWSICLFMVFCILYSSYHCSTSLMKGCEEGSNNQESSKTAHCLSPLFLPLYSKGLAYVRPSRNTYWIAECIKPDLMFQLYLGMRFLFLFKYCFFIYSWYKILY